MTKIRYNYYEIGTCKGFQYMLKFVHKQLKTLTFFFSKTKWEEQIK